MRIYNPFKRLNDLDERVEELAVNHQSEIDDVKDSTENNENKLDDLESRIDEVESDQVGQRQIEDIEDRLDDQKDDVERLIDRTNNLELAIEELKKQISEKSN